MVSSSALIRVENMKWNAVTQRAPSTISPLYRTRQTPSTTGRFTFSIKSMTIVARPLPLQNKRGVARKKKKAWPKQGVWLKTQGVVRVSRRGFYLPTCKQMALGTCLFFLLSLFIAHSHCGLSPLFRARRDADKTGRYIILLQSDISDYEFNKTLEKALSLSQDKRPYVVVRYVEKAFTLDLNAYSLYQVKIKK